MGKRAADALGQPAGGGRARGPGPSATWRLTERVGRAPVEAVDLWARHALRGAWRCRASDVAVRRTGGCRWRRARSAPRRGRAALRAARSAIASGPIVAGRLAPMAQGHKDRLSAVDASFLHEERQASHMHVGAIVLLDGPPPDRGGVPQHIESRLHLVPRYRQKLAFPRFEMGRPFWVDDPRFNIDYHVRHSGLPPPGNIEQLRQLARADLLPAPRPLEAALGDVARAGARGVVGFALDLEDPPRAGGRGLRRRHRHRAVRPDAGAGGGARWRSTAWMPASEPSEVELVAEGVKGTHQHACAARRGAAQGRPAAGARLSRRVREALEGSGRGGVGDPRRGAGRSTERADRPTPPGLLGAERPGRLQGREERARRHGERRLPGHRGRRARQVAAQPRREHR